MYRKYSEKEIRNIVGLISKRAEGSIYAAITVYALGGKASQINPFETAFWTDPAFAEENTQWLKKRFPYVKSLT
ncbi:hypothetical protein P4361_02075 [Fictibacillus sp. B-59209]|uniref:hypothetical protein n=1 Tax=Fictibacillus sp. B-59209 TaxID=3024873 RepID=UPI002E1E9BE4|nr:hypothetical protein [Fictibacillus sp. B-59209]